MTGEIHPIAEVVVSVCLVVGALFVFVGSLGLVRMRDFYSRQHGPSKSSTLGAGATLLGSIIYFTVRGGALSLHEILITFFLFITAPVSAHLLAKAALHLKLPNVSGAPEEGSGVGGRRSEVGGSRGRKSKVGSTRGQASRADA